LHTIYIQKTNNMTEVKKQNKKKTSQYKAMEQTQQYLSFFFFLKKGNKL